MCRLSHKSQCGGTAELIDRETADFVRGLISEALTYSIFVRCADAPPLAAEGRTAPPPCRGGAIAPVLLSRAVAPARERAEPLALGISHEAAGRAAVGFAAGERSLQSGAQAE